MLLAGVMETPVIDENPVPVDQAAILYSVTESGSAILEGIDPAYTGIRIAIPDTINGAWVYRIESGFLEGSQVRHVLLDTLPNSVADDAFSCVDGVTLYADNSRIIMENWAQGIPVHPEKEYESIPLPPAPRHVDRQANLVALANNSLFVLGLAAVLLAGLWLLGKLRVSNGFDAPYAMKRGFFKKLYTAGAAMGAVIAFLLVFGENFTYYADYMQMMVTVNGYVKTYGIPVAGILLGLVFIRDFFRKDFLWLLPRIVIRASLTVLYVGLGAGAGLLLAALGNNMLIARGAIIMVSIAIPAMALAMIIAPIMVMTGLDKVSISLSDVFAESFSSAPESGNSDSYRTTSVRGPDGSLHTVRHYSHGSYVDGEQVFSSDSSSVTGTDGTNYTKQ